MNKTFKVVFNKVRGAFMVANEVTSSVQKKGCKAVIALAALTVSTLSPRNGVTKKRPRPLFLMSRVIV